MRQPTGGDDALDGGVDVEAEEAGPRPLLGEAEAGDGIRLLNGEDLDTLSRGLGVTASKLSEWRDDFLAGAEAGLKSREPSAVNDENQRLKAKFGELLMDNELLRVRAGIDPFPWGKSRG